MTTTSRTPTASATAAPPRPVTIGRRLLARFVDIVVMAVLVLPFAVWSAERGHQAPSETLWWPLWLIGLSYAAPVAYETSMLALRGQTVGKSLVHLRVLSLDGRTPSLARLLVRTALAWLWAPYFFSALRLGTGFQLACLLAGIVVFGTALVTRSHRGLHDVASGTQVAWDPTADVTRR